MALPTELRPSNLQRFLFRGTRPTQVALEKTAVLQQNSSTESLWGIQFQQETYDSQGRWCRCIRGPCFSIQENNTRFDDKPPWRQIARTNRINRCCNVKPSGEMSCDFRSNDWCKFNNFSGHCSYSWLLVTPFHDFSTIFCWKNMQHILLTERDHMHVYHRRDVFRNIRIFHSRKI